MAAVNQWKWVNQFQPQTLYMATILCYVDAVFGLLFNFRFLPSLLVAGCLALGAFGILSPGTVPRMDGQNLSLDVRRDGDSTWVLATGELDQASAPQLRDCLTALNGEVVLDLTALAFLDSTGLGVLIRANRELQE